MFDKSRMNSAYFAKFVTVKDFDQICRTCLGDAQVFPIVNTMIGDLEVIDMLEYTAVIQVNKDDLLPQNMCESCLNEVYKVYEFKKQCQRNEAALKLLAENVHENDKSDKEEESPSDTINENSRNDKEEFFSKTTSMVEEELGIKSESSNYNKEPITDEIQANNTISEQYKCNACNYTSSTNEELQKHQEACKHPKRRYRKCKECNRMVHGFSFRQHMLTHTREKPYQCDICPRSFSTGSSLRHHKMTHTGERPYICSICGKGFIRGKTLRVHEKAHKKQDNVASEGVRASKYFCNVCGRNFKLLLSFKTHMEKHKLDPVTWQVPKSENELRDHICEFCGRAYKTLQHLKTHKLSHGKNSFLCSDCGKGFVRKDGLLLHMKIHTGEKPHSCVICEKSFSNVMKLKLHMRVHSGQKPYSCSYCDWSFKQLPHLKTHLKTHSGERPYTCAFCGKRFAVKGNLTVHVRTHTGETPYECPVCGKGYHDSSSMKRHHRSHQEV